ncbi:MAG: radical SAM protein [Candidatus Omnitrophota bacterium]
MNECKLNNSDLPNYCCIALLESCFLRCRMCYKWQSDIDHRSGMEPTIAEWKSFIYSLRGMVKGRFQINFAGGEPLAREETLLLIDYASKLGFDTLLATNGYLINETMAKKIACSGLNTVNISLDSLIEERHDYIRGVRGVYSKVLSAIDLLDKYAPGVRVGICTVIMNENMDELEDIVKWTQDNKKVDGMGFQAVTQPFSTPEDNLWHRNASYSHLWPVDLDRMDMAMGKLIEMKKNGFSKLGNPLSQFNVYKAYFRNPNDFIKKKMCHIDSQAINITPEGEIRICFYMDKIGDVKHDDIRDVWFSDSAKSVRRKISQCKRNCQALVNCNFDNAEDYIV